MFSQIITIFHVIVCFGIIAVVLLQHGKGAEVGAAYGSGASQTVFGSQGSTSFLAKFTWFLALLLVTTSLFLGILSNRNPTVKSVTEKLNLDNISIQQENPKAPVAADEVPIIPKSSK